MRLFPKTVCVAATAFLLLANPAEGEARKCPGGLTRSGNQPFIAVDGSLVDATAIDMEALDIVAMEVGCILVPEGARLVKYNGIAIVTKSGAAGLMRSYLDQLVLAQEAFRSTHGHYATDLYSLAFFASRPVFSSGIEMVAVDGRWTATMSFDGLGTSCQVSWPVLHVDQTDAPAAEVLCRQREEGISE